MADVTPQDSFVSLDVSADVALSAVQQRLLAAFDGPLGTEAVLRSIKMAVDAVRFFGDDPQLRGALVERIARNELELLQEGRNERAWS